MSGLLIGCDAHKHYSQLEVQDSSGRVLRQARINHAPGALRTFFASVPQGTPVALESVGNWYWIADEIEACGCQPLLTNPAKAKLLMGHVNKTDKAGCQRFGDAASSGQSALGLATTGRIARPA